jgi:hypothetical protein
MNAGGDILISKQQPTNPCAQREDPNESSRADKLSLIHIQISFCIILSTVPRHIVIAVVRPNKRLRRGIIHIALKIESRRQFNSLHLFRAVSSEACGCVMG